MTDQACTALTADGEIPDNPLFTPPCSCPRCAPQLVYERSRDDGWLRLPGRRQRHRVEVVEFGDTGKAVLG